MMTRGQFPKSGLTGQSVNMSFHMNQCEIANGECLVLYRTDGRWRAVYSSYHCRVGLCGAACANQRRMLHH